MSIKIYEAYKMKNPDKLWNFCRDVKKKGQKEVKEILKTTYKYLEDNDDFKEEIRKEFNIDNEQKIGLAHISWYIMDRYNKQQTSTVDNSYNFDLFICFYEHDGEIYLTQGEGLAVKGSLDFLDKRDDLIDFKYWNNTDKPKDIDQKEWNKREKVWKDIIKRMMLF